MRLWGHFSYAVLTVPLPVALTHPVPAACCLARFLGLLAPGVRLGGGGERCSTQGPASSQVTNGAGKQILDVDVSVSFCISCATTQNVVVSRLLGSGVEDTHWRVGRKKDLNVSICVEAALSVLEVPFPAFLAGTLSMRQESAEV